MAVRLWRRVELCGAMLCAACALLLGHVDCVGVGEVCGLRACDTPTLPHWQAIEPCAGHHAVDDCTAAGGAVGQRLLAPADLTTPTLPVPPRPLVVPVLLAAAPPRAGPTVRPPADRAPPLP